MFPTGKKSNAVIVTLVVVSLVLIAVVSMHYSVKINNLLMQQARDLKDKATSSYKKGLSKGAQSVTTDEQIDNVAKMVRENPVAYKDFLQQMVDIACKNSPGLAIQVEQYASAEMRRKMEQLLKDANVAKLYEKKVEIDSLNLQVSKLEKEKAALAVKLVSVNTGAKSPENKKLVPVLLSVNGAGKFTVTSKSDGRIWEFGPYGWCHNSFTETEVALPPGQYTIKRGYWKKSLEATVSETPNFHWRKWWYNGHFVVFDE